MEWERRKLSQSARNRKMLEGGGSKGGGLSVGGRNMQFGEGWTKVLAGRKIGFHKIKRGPGQKTSKKNISGPTQTLGQVTESTKRPVNTVSFLMSRGMNYLTGLFVTGGISKGATSALKNNNEEKKQKKRVGRTILSP